MTSPEYWSISHEWQKQSSGLNVGLGLMSGLSGLAQSAKSPCIEDLNPPKLDLNQP